MLHVDLLVLLCKEDFGNFSSRRSLLEDVPEQLRLKQTPGNSNQVLILSGTELEKEVTAAKNKNC